MDSNDDITVKVLIDIRDDIRAVRAELREGLGDVREEIRETNRRLEVGLSETNQRITHSEIRLATAITDLAGSVNDTNALLREQLDLRDRVARCETDIAELKRQR